MCQFRKLSILYDVNPLCVHCYETEHIGLSATSSKIAGFKPPRAIMKASLLGDLCLVALEDTPDHHRSHINLLMISRNATDVR